MRRTLIVILLSAAALSATELGFQPIGSRVEKTVHNGRKAVHLVPENGGALDTDIFAIADGLDVRDGEIEVYVAGAPRPDAPDGARGFIGLAFHVQGRGERFECFYIRPTNGRVRDQVRRNHATQYISWPDYPWQKLRKEQPGMYESYADVQPGVWTKLRIVIRGTEADLYVNDATEPSLIVNDLKLGSISGGIALWATATTDAYFADLKTRPR